ncbi:A/G-specific adenine glycosylase [Microbacterium arabinogalactanolyticum]|uniref:A/G-specific adenine glycosylase n=1 Tax=Microbacterium arabinogalactanolyticum TaxID=69365 RepID=UPI002556F3CE|nr:A/G-specific adenine glycosylase [Microbacterium arabinogalactanolyticum]GLC84741.1 adenine glycosylase [Microbacterium arabinogalactanolyticum]
MPRAAVLPHALAAWYRQEARDLPWRRTEFAERYGAWGTLVSEFMLQQTPVTRVIPHLQAWLERWPTPAAMAAATPAEVVHQWANLGYPRRALWLHRAAIEVVERHGGTVPRDVSALLALSGIGDYTARAVAVFSYGDRHPVVDTNTRRVIARAVDGRAQPDAPAKRDLERMAQLLPEDVAESATFNAAMMELGAVICTARAPRCDVCPIAASCAWLQAGRPDTGDRRRRQAKYEGSDRQARGGVLHALRHAEGHRMPADAVLADWPDAVQRDRAIDSLIGDGLVEAVDGLLRLPV